MEPVNGGGQALTIGNVGDLAQYVVSADLFVPFWWADQRLADHSHIDFGTDASVCGLKVQGNVRTWFSAHCSLLARRHNSGNLTAALSWSTEKLQTSHVSGSFSFVAKIFLMADR